jgi:hypothetical protein
MQRPPLLLPTRIPAWLPGVATLVAVVLLLRGPAGAWELVCVQAETLAGSLVGGPDAVGLVVWQTAPLGLAAAGISFAVSARWLRFQSFAAVVAAALVVLGAAVVGGELRTAATRNLAANAPDAINVRSLAEVEWLAAPDLSMAPARVLPVELLPEVGGLLGYVGKAVNQLAGYVIAYNPRLFAASLLAGGYLGWSWQRRVAGWRNRFASRPASSPPVRRAA